jgi:hypothetical protein
VEREHDKEEQDYPEEEQTLNWTCELSLTFNADKYLHMKLETVGMGGEFISGLGLRPFVVDQPFVLDLNPNAHTVYYKPNVHTVLNHKLNSLSHLNPKSFQPST